MTLKSVFLILGLSVSIAACTDAEITTRNTPFEPVPAAGTDAKPQADAASAAAARSVADVSAKRGVTLEPGKSPVTVTSVAVSVPHSLKVSESNSYLPSGDIVWREDPPGNRHEQVKTIVETAIKRGVAPLDGPVKVSVEIQMLKFHALTEKARYTTGGVHGLSFLLAVRDAQTGELIVPVREVRADLRAYGGRQALAAEARGVTQKVRITGHLAEVIRQELTNPEGYSNASLGFIQALNYM